MRREREDVHRAESCLRIQESATGRFPEPHQFDTPSFLNTF
jgi:hypothetical protein